MLFLFWRFFDGDEWKVERLQEINGLREWVGRGQAGRLIERMTWKGRNKGMTQGKMLEKSDSKTSHCHIH